jgi:hypothetical protein
MVYVKMNAASGPGSTADGASAILLSQHLVVFGNTESVATPQIHCPNLLGSPDLLFHKEPSVCCR